LSNLELQQDYYNKQQVAIFIVLVVRYRRKGEGDAAASYAYSLPSHLTCDVHTFISGDRRHDDGLAMICWEKLAQHTKEVNAKLGLSPRKVIKWSDGAPNQFKFTRPLRFLDKLKLLGGFLMVWWMFYASCHGKGMQDAAGAWIKSRVARAVLLGADIKSVRAFFEYCLTFLTTQAMVADHGSTAFTSARFFYLVEDNELAVYRARLPEVCTWSRARECHHFWATDKKGVIGRRLVGCICKTCAQERFRDCEHRDELTVDGIFENAPAEYLLEARYPEQRTRDEDIAFSEGVLRKARVATILAIRPDVIVPTAADIDFDSDEDDDGKPVEELPPPDILADYWLCWVTQKYVPVTDAAGKMVEGVHIRGGDGYAMIQWMEHSHDEDGCRIFAKENVPVAVLFAAGSVVPVKVGKLGQGSETFVVGPPQHDAIMAQLQPVGYLKAMAES